MEETSTILNAIAHTQAVSKMFTIVESHHDESPTISRSQTLKRNSLASSSVRNERSPTITKSKAQGRLDKRSALLMRLLK